MKKLWSAAFLIHTSVFAQNEPEKPHHVNKKVEKATTKKIEVKETKKIVIDASPESSKKETKFFCGKTEPEARSACEAWVGQNIKSLGKRLLTSSCMQPKRLSAKGHSCDMGQFEAEGSISYTLNTK